MRVVICHRSVRPYDAIGNEIAEMVRHFGSRAECLVYGEQVDLEGVRTVDRHRLRSLLAQPSTVVIYHHSLHWEDGERFLGEAKARIVVRYHGITPETFFARYDPTLYALCREGRRQTARLASRHREALWIANSSFSLADAQLTGLPSTVVVPPLHAIERWGASAPDEMVLKGLIESPWTNLLFVGRVVPHKGHGLLVRIVADR